MTFVEAVVLGLALCVDTLVVLTTCGLKSKFSYSRGLLLAATFALFQGGFPLLGALIGNVCQRLIESVDHWIAFGLLAAVGVKMIVDGIRSDEGKGNFDVSRFWVICTLAVATSIDAFVVGIGLGVDNTIPQILMTVLVIAVVTFLSAMLGVFLGKRKFPIPTKWASITAGVVLIGLGVHTLYEHGVFSFINL